MSEYIRLAKLLEEAARLLRQADGVTSRLRCSDGTPIEEMPGFNRLSCRTRKGLDRSPRIGTKEQLLTISAGELLGRKNFGIRSLNELRKWLGSQGLHLRGELYEG